MVKIFESAARKPHRRLTPAPAFFIVALGDWQRYPCLGYRLQPINPGGGAVEKNHPVQMKNEPRLRRGLIFSGCLFLRFGYYQLAFVVDIIKSKI
jgi:hypothetical protein